MAQNEINKKNQVSKQKSVYLTGLPSNASDIKKISSIQKAAVAATDFSWLKDDDSVLIKPVVNSGNLYPATTGPHAITAMIKLLKDKGAGRIVVGDLAGIRDVRFYPDHLEGSTRILMEQTGIVQATLKAGGELHCFEEAGWNEFYPEKAISRNWKKPLMIPSILKEMDHIILLPRCARHLMAASTLGLKAVVGYMRTDTRMELHRDAKTFYEKITEANTIQTLRKKQRLILTVADKILTTYGPNEGYVSQPEMGLVIASESIVAHDMISLAWLLENRKNTPAEELNCYKDSSKRFSNRSNKNTVRTLSRNWKTAIFSQRLKKEHLETIWDDLVLRHAFNIFDGIPKITLESNDDIIPEKLQMTLQKAVSIK